MARGDWGTENRTRSVISSCAGIQNPIFLTQTCKNTQTQTNIHSHLEQGQTCSVAEVTNIEPACFFVIIFVIKRDIQLLYTGRECLVFLKIHNDYKHGQVRGTYYNDLQFHKICTQYFQIHTLHADWFSPICSFCSVGNLHTV